MRAAEATLGFFYLICVCQIATSSPSVFVYDLETPSSCRLGTMYTLEVELPRHLKQAQVTDAESADFLFVPARPHCFPNVEKRVEYIRTVLAEIRKVGQWEKRPERHMWLFSSDHGKCGFGPGEHALELLNSSIVLTHFGMTVPETNGNDFAEGTFVDGSGCFAQGKDIVVPYNTQPLAHHLDTPCAAYPRPGPHLFFAGSDGIHNHRGIHYSKGVRQVLFKMWKDHPDFELVAQAPDSRFDVAQFCLAPLGGGWGNRLHVAMMHGCIPLIIQPNTVLPYDDVLNYETFAVKIELNKVHRLPHILRHYVSKTPWMQQHSDAACSERAKLIWEWDHPKGVALSTLMQVLKLRLNAGS
jgi:hypothetical protein